MSRYLIDQLATRPNIDVLVSHARSSAAHGDDALEAIDVRNAETGETTRLDSGGLFIFIGADAETGWLPPEIALDRRGYVLTGPDVAAAGRWQLERDPYLLETSVPGIFACGDVRFGPVKRVAAAVGEGSMAIAFVHQYAEIWMHNGMVELDEEKMSEVPRRQHLPALGSESTDTAGRQSSPTWHRDAAGSRSRSRTSSSRTRRDAWSGSATTSAMPRPATRTKL